MKLYSELAEYYYFIENNGRNISNDVFFIRNYLPNKIPVYLLDIGCGTGEHCNLLSREAVKCTGIDSSEDMIKIAKKRYGGIEFLVSDMKKFEYFEKYDCAISLFGSMDYLLDNNEINLALWNTRNALKKNGIAIFEIWSAEPVLLIRKKEISHVSTTIASGKKIKRERGFNVINDSDVVTVQVDYRYEISGGTDVKQLTDSHTMRAYRTGEFDDITKENGFKIIDKFSSTQKEKVKSNSNRIIYVLEKN